MPIDNPTCLLHPLELQNYPHIEMRWHWLLLNDSSGAQDATQIFFIPLFRLYEQINAIKRNLCNVVIVSVKKKEMARTDELPFSYILQSIICKSLERHSSISVNPLQYRLILHQYQLMASQKALVKCWSQSYLVHLDSSRAYQGYLFPSKEYLIRTVSRKISNIGL